MRNYRPTWKLDLEEPVAGNYFPVTSKILIRDQRNDIELSVLTDRAQGGSSLRDGEIELMVHRRMLHDDAFGVGEALNETAFGKGLVARGSHFVFIGKYLQDAAMLQAQVKDATQRKILASWTFFSPTNNLVFGFYKKKYLMEYSGLLRSVPSNVQILTLEPWKKSDLLLRLEHVFEKSDAAGLSKPAVVDLENLFKPFKLKTVTEMTLGANQKVKEHDNELHFASGKSLDAILQQNLVDSLDFSKNTQVHETLEYLWLRNVYKADQCESNFINEFDFASNLELDESSGMKIDLNPMQIRTFILEVDMV